MSDPTGLIGRVVERVPATLQRMLAGAADHHTVTLAAGLAFFGLVSFAPAIGFALGIVRLVAGEQVVQELVETLKNSYSSTLGFSGLLEQMQGRALRYAGFGLLLLLWPATTLASGWTRALDAIEDNDSPPGVRGVLGRLKGLALGLLLMGGVLGLVGAVLAASRVRGGQATAVSMAAVVAAGFAFTVVFCLVVYRVLPTAPRDWRTLWPGALLAATAIAGATAVFGIALAVVNGLASQYPPSLSTAVVLGFWLYASNVGLLLGAELNAAHRDDARDA